MRFGGEREEGGLGNTSFKNSNQIKNVSIPGDGLPSGWDTNPLYEYVEGIALRIHYDIGSFVIIEDLVKKNLLKGLNRRA